MVVEPSGDEQFPFSGHGYLHAPRQTTPESQQARFGLVRENELKDGEGSLRVGLEMAIPLDVQVEMESTHVAGD
jgi:hypothetical protein